MAAPMIQVAQRQPAAQRRRRTRSPVIEYANGYYPSYVYMDWFHPVLPGETVKTIQDTSRIELTGLQYSVTGWHLYEYLFFVPLRAMPNFDSMEAMFVDPTAEYSPATAYSHANAESVNGNQLAREATTAICNGFFRMEAGKVASGSILSSPSFQMMHNSRNIFDSMMAGMLPDQDFDIDLDASGTVTAFELDEAMTRYEQMTQLGFTDMDFDDYLAANTGRLQKPELPEPELLRFTRQWQMPTRIVEPSTGAPTNYILFNGRINTSSRKYFKEPGVIWKGGCIYPKIFVDNMYPAAGNLITGKDFMPPESWDRPLANMREQAEQTGPVDFGVASGVYSYDMKDLFEHGDQFLGRADTNANIPVWTKDISSSTMEYLTTAAINALDDGGTMTDAAVTGRAGLSILTRVKDMTVKTGLPDPVA